MSPGTGWRIERAGLDDLPQLAPLFDAYRQFYEQPSDLPLAERYLRERLDRGESLVWIAWQGAQAIGFCQCYPTFCSVAAAPIFALYDLCVQPAARGLGAARGLMQAAEDEARMRGCVRLDLSTARTNLPAQALYESLGWQRDEVYLYFSRKVAPPS
jgi:ribosomal protein S18 acetylase RimI-like enzyme